MSNSGRLRSSKYVLYLEFFRVVCCLLRLRVYPLLEVVETYSQDRNTTTRGMLSTRKVAAIYTRTSWGQGSPVPPFPKERHLSRLPGVRRIVHVRDQQDYKSSANDSSSGLICGLKGIVLTWNRHCGEFEFHAWFMPSIR